MTRVKFGLKFRPRNIGTRAQLLNQDFRKETDKMIVQVRNTMMAEMIKAAPGPGQPGPGVPKGVTLAPRTGRLKRGITALPIKKSGSGSIDRRATIIVESRSPHTRFVIRGVSSRLGEGAKGKGRYLPALGKRMRFGFYPGFKAYDFISVAKRRTDVKLAKLSFGTVEAFKKHIRRRLSV
jgi:hypothetical protein